MSRIYKTGFLSLITFSWVLSLASQNTCRSYEEKMELHRRSESNLAKAETMYNEYTSLDCADMLIAYNFIGYAHYNASNLEKAKEFLIRGEDEFFDKEIKPEQYSINQMYTALILLVEKDFDSALYHLKKAETYALESTDKFVQASVYQNLGLHQVEIDSLDKAEVYFNKAVYLDALDKISTGYIYQNLAVVYNKRDNSEKTEEFISKTKAIWNQTGNFKGQYLLSFIEAEYYLKKKEFKSALSYLKRGRSQYKAEGKLLLGKNYLIEATIQDSLANPKAKLIALENAILESDGLSETELKKAIKDLSNLQASSKTNVILADLVTKLKFQSINQKKINVVRNKIMDKETAEDETVIKTQLKYLFLLGAILVLLSYLFLRIRKQNSNIQHLNQSLEASNNEIENQLQISNQKNKELEQFAFVASHDLKSPLRTISSFAGLIKKQDLSEKSNNYLDIIINSAKNMGELISELLKYSTLDQNLSKTKVNLKELISETLERNKSQIEESKAIISIDENCNRPIACDDSLFSTVIQNLVVNAIIYCDDGVQPQINISSIESGNHIKIKVSDNGIGIPESYQSTIFEMFKRLKSKKVDGTGIGLASCKKIIEKHGGKISVTSQGGKGSSFILEIPNIYT